MIKFGGTPKLRALLLVSSAALLIIANAPARAQTAEEQARSYSRAVMEQALQTKERFDLYGLHFDSDSATIQPELEIAPRRHSSFAQEFPGLALEDRRTYGFDRRSAAQLAPFVGSRDSHPGGPG